MTTAHGSRVARSRASTSHISDRIRTPPIRSVSHSHPTARCTSSISTSCARLPSSTADRRRKAGVSCASPSTTANRIQWRRSPQGSIFRRASRCASTAIATPVQRHPEKTIPADKSPREVLADRPCRVPDHYWADDGRALDRDTTLPIPRSAPGTGPHTVTTDNTPSTVAPR